MASTDLVRVTTNSTSDDLLTLSINFIAQQFSIITAIIWLPSVFISLTENIIRDSESASFYTACWILFLAFERDLMAFVRSIRPLLFDDEVDDMEDEEYEDTVHEIVSMEDQSDDPSDEAVEEDQDWDLGSAEDTLQYLPELKKEEEDRSREVTEAIRAIVKMETHSEKSFIASTLATDEYLLAKGMIDATRFGETLMTEF